MFGPVIRVAPRSEVSATPSFHASRNPSLPCEKRMWNIKSTHFPFWIGASKIWIGSLRWMRPYLIWNPWLPPPARKCTEIGGEYPVGFLPGSGWSCH